MWKEQLAAIRKMEEELGGDPESGGQEIDKLIETARERLAISALTEAYLAFLEMVNGLDFNGLVIYGGDKFLLTNEPWEEGTR